VKPLSFGRKTAPSNFAGTPVTPARRALVNDPTHNHRREQGPSSGTSKEERHGQASKAAVVDYLYDIIAAELPILLPKDDAKGKTRAELASILDERVRQAARAHALEFTDGDARDCVTVLLNEYIDLLGGLDPDPLSELTRTQRAAGSSRQTVMDAKERLRHSRTEPQ
jgi:hypothetical protein